MFAIGDKTTEKIVYMSATYFSGEPGKVAALQFGSTQFKIDRTKLSFYSLTEDEEKRVSNGDEYSLLWESGVISGIDFSLEDNKLQLSFSASEKVINNGVNESVVSCTVYTSKNKKDTSFSGNKLVPVKMPSGQVVNAGFVFVDGVAEKTFSSATPGRFIIPATPRRFGIFRVKESVIIEAIL